MNSQNTVTRKLDRAMKNELKKSQEELQNEREIFSDGEVGARQRKQSSSTPRRKASEQGRFPVDAQVSKTPQKPGSSRDKVKPQQPLQNGAGSSSSELERRSMPIPSDSKTITKEVKASKEKSDNRDRKLRSPPPYEIAVSSLEKRKVSKEYQPITLVVKDGKVSSTPPQVQISSYQRQGKHRSSRDESDTRTGNSTENFLSRKASSESKGSMASSLTSDPSVYNDSVPCSSCERLSQLPDGEGSPQQQRSGSGSIVQTRVRDIKEVINEKVQRSESSEHLLRIGSPQPSPREYRSSSVDLDSVSLQLSASREYIESGRDRVKKIKAAAQGREPYSPHPGRRSKSQEDIRRAESRESLKHSGSKEKLPYKETTLGSVITTVETYTEDNSLKDTFEKIDAAFGFRSYGPSKSAAAQDRKPRKKRVSKHRPKAQERHTSSSDGDESSTRGTPLVRRRGSSKARDSKDRPSSTGSISRNKSEAEESLEASIREFHTTLSSLPQNEKRQSSSDKASSNDTLSGSRRPVSPRIATDGSSSTEKLAERVPPRSRTPTNYRRGSGPAGERSSRDSSYYDRLRKADNITTSRSGTPSDTDSLTRKKNSVPQQSSLDSTPVGVKQGQVSELVNKFSETAPSSRKDSTDSVLSTSSDRDKSRSEAKLSLIASPKPWQPKDFKHLRLKSQEDIISHLKSDQLRAEMREPVKGSDLDKMQSDYDRRGTPSSGRATPQNEIVFDSRSDTLSPLPAFPPSPGWHDACEKGMYSLPGRGKKSGTVSKANGECFFKTFTIFYALLFKSIIHERKINLK